MERRHQAMAAGLGVSVLLLAFTLWGEDAPRPETEPPVELAQPAPPPAAAPPAPAPAPTPAPAPSASAQGLVLYGISGGGSGGMAAIIGGPSMGQRVVPVGREVRPGLALKEVGPGYAILAGGGAETRLELNRYGNSPAASAQPTATAQAQPAGRAALAGMDGLDAMAGLAPRRSGARVNGFTLKEGARLPALARAGLRPGDVILSVNGQPFDSREKVMELPQELAGSYTAEFVFERGGKRMKATLPVNPRPAQ